MNVIALIDGEHYPPVTRWGLEKAADSGFTVLAALAIGGAEKLPVGGELAVGSVEVIRGDDDPVAALREAIGLFLPEAVLDLSDEPVAGYERRMELAAVALAAGVSYVGPDFRFDPPITGKALPTPSLAVIGTGKRVGKTAVAGHVARLCASRGERPVIVAMGRGGPQEPATAGPADVELSALLARVEAGQHAASDFLEDALTAGVTTVGARRCGGGLAGKPFATNIEEAASVAVSMDAGLIILEGSGASVPTVPWDAGILVMPASLPMGHVRGYFGPFRLLLSDLAVIMMEYGSHSGPDNLSTLYPEVRRLHPDIRVVAAELLPVPMADVRGKDALFTTTAQSQLAERQAARLEQSAGCRIVMTSPHLGYRERLEQDLGNAPPFDVLLTELKGAGVDVAARRALERSADVVFVDNRPETVEGDGEVDDLLLEAASLAKARAAERLNAKGNE
ncbi:MAG TPA: 2,3-diphosphoglycerate synthetase [Actinomycetota bacterium]|nr:2,3-diphosphoglycerate synthetase [Actinomycetota bacterium]